MAETAWNLRGLKRTAALAAALASLAAPVFAGNGGIVVSGSGDHTAWSSERKIVQNGYGVWAFYFDNNLGCPAVTFSQSGAAGTWSAPVDIFASGTCTGFAAGGYFSIWYIDSSSQVIVAAQDNLDLWLTIGNLTSAGVPTNTVPSGGWPSNGHAISINGYTSGGRVWNDPNDGLVAVTFHPATKVGWATWSGCVGASCADGSNVRHSPQTVRFSTTTLSSLDTQPFDLS